jgi:DNA-binding response OmpR family regulator
MPHMFDFAGRLRGNRALEGASASRAAVSLLVLTRDVTLCDSASEAAARCHWDLRLAETIDAGLQILCGFPARVIIYDWNSETDDWSSAVDRLTGLPHSPRILLASRVVDEYLWTELLNHGGFDVISRSAAPDELIQSVRFADRSTDIRGRGRSLTS